jgi:formate dehydrogenase subunit gamma
MAFQAWDEKDASEVIAAHATQDGATLPILHALQEVFGCVPDGAVQMVAKALNLSRAEIYGVVSFYPDFRDHRPGRHVLKLCRAEACQSMGGEALANHAQQRLGTDWGETTKDGVVTLEPVFCLGLCACAPAAMLDRHVVGRLDRERLDALLDSAGAR